MEDILTKFVGNIAASAPPPAPTPAPAPKTMTPLASYLSSVTQKANANVEALRSKSPFLTKLGADATKIVHSVASAADRFVGTSAANVRDAITGKLPVTLSDVGSGTLATAEGVGKVAQGFNAGIVRILKSAGKIVAPDFANSPLGKLAADPSVAPVLKSLGGNVAGTDPIHSYQEIYAKAHDYATSNNATPTAAKIFAGSAVIGSLFMDNPFFGPESAGIKLGIKEAEAVAKAGTEKGVVDILKGAGIPEDVAKHVAPTLVKTSTVDEVHAAIDQINQGVKTARAVADGVQPVERKFITSVKEHVPVLGERVAGQYIPRDTDALAQTARDLINKDINKAETLAETGTDDNAVATAVQLIRHYTQAAEAADAATKNALLDKAAEVANTIARKLTESGRSVQAASILGRITPEGQVRVAAREIQKFNETARPSAKVPELSGEQVGRLSARAKQIIEMPDGLEKAKEFQKFEDEIAALVPTPFFRKAISVWKAGLLTGLKTSGLNTASNLFHGISEIAKDVPAVAVDKFASLFTGKRTVALTPRGLLSGGGEGVKKGWSYIKTGIDERDILAKLDIKRVNFGTSPLAKAIQRYEETVFHVLGAEDQPFYYGAKAHSITSQAIAEGKNQGLSTKEIQDLIENPTDEMVRNATLDAEIAVFQNPTILGDLISWARKSRAGAAVDIIVPFSRTPAAVASQMFNYSPAGIIKEVVSEVKKGRFDQRQFSQAAGRAAVGTGVLYLGSQLLDGGFLALGRPTGEREQKEWELEGKQANSIKIGGKWRQAASLGPAGMAMIIGGYIADGAKATGSMWDGLTEGAAGAGAALTQQTFLQGLNSFLDAVNDPVNYAHGLFNGLVGSLVPTIVGDVARASDTAERQTQRGYFSGAQGKIPGLREQLQPKVDTFGRVIAPPGFLTALADPTRPTKISNDPAVLEIKRLTDAGFAVAPTQLGNKNGFKALTPKQNTALWKHTGDLIHSKLTNLFKTDLYKNLDDEGKAKAVATFIDKSNNLSRAEMVLHLTKDLSGSALKTELSRLKKGGLLTKAVYNLYTDIR